MKKLLFLFIYGLEVTERLPEQGNVFYCDEDLTENKVGVKTISDTYFFEMNILILTVKTWKKYKKNDK